MRFSKKKYELFWGVRIGNTITVKPLPESIIPKELQEALRKLTK